MFAYVKIVCIFATSNNKKENKKMPNVYQQIKKNDIDLITMCLFCPQHYLLNRDTIDNTLLVQELTIWEYQNKLILTDDKVDNLIYQLLKKQGRTKKCVSQS
jgi:hypothetical protein